MKLLPQFKDDFARNVLTLLSGTVLAQLLSLLVAPLLTWYYLPEDMAVAEMYLRVVLLLAVAATARYEMAIVLPKLNEDAISLVKLCLMITIGVSVLSLGLILVGGEKLVNYLELPGLTDYLFIIPVSVLIAGGYQSLNYWQIRNKFYRNISTANISSALVNNGVKLSVGVASSLGPLGLILGNLLGQFVGLLLFLGKSLKYLISPGNQESSIPGNAKVYKNFPLVNMPHAFTDAIRELVIITIILYYFGGVTMGIYAFVVRVLKMPIALVGSSMSQVFFQEASEKYANNEDIFPIVKRT
ncbi:MAG: oligosaccharide flippase family protein [Flavobacteriales bacterium]|nr:oligosaccharide flippase family protein [Flavobacteriales bacterium]